MPRDAKTADMCGQHARHLHMLAMIGVAVAPTIVVLA
jgi:hypothetical protein